MKPRAPRTPPALDRPLPDHAGAAFEAAYAELRAIAAREVKRLPAGSSLDATALVHEVYLKLSRNAALCFEHKAQLRVYAARAMRHLLADRARHHRRLRAGGDWLRVTLTGADPRMAVDHAEGALALDAALERLAAIDPRAAQVVELRYFAGLPTDVVAETLGIGLRTAERDWGFARAFLQAELE